MPKIGEIRKGQETGHKGSGKYIWVACTQCGKERWQLVTARRELCLKCALKTRIVIVSQKNIDTRVASLIARRPKNCKTSEELGKKGHYLLYLQICSKCGKQTYVRKRDLQLLCKDCRKRTGEKHHNWKGGKHINSEGYILVTLPYNSPHILMAQRSSCYGSHQIQEHRLIMAQYLDRLLEPWEIVHHINGNRQDNRIENLELLPKASEHVAYTRMQNEIKRLQTRVTLLEAEIELYKNQVVEAAKRDKIIE